MNINPQTSELIKNVSKPNSLLIIAKPESGKTEALKKFTVNKNIAYLSDVTGFGIEGDYLPKIEAGEIRHIIIPDLLKPLSRKESTVKAFITYMNALIEKETCKINGYRLTSTPMGGSKFECTSVAHTLS